MINKFSYTYYIPKGCKVVSTIVTSDKDIEESNTYGVVRKYICDDSTEIVVEELYDRRDFGPECVFITVNGNLLRSAEIIDFYVSKECIFNNGTCETNYPEKVFYKQD